MVFDDLISDENGKSAWTYTCQKHRPKLEQEYQGATEESPIDCTCGVQGCDNKADHYFTFLTERA